MIDLDALDKSVREMTAEFAGLRLDLTGVGKRQVKQTRVSWTAIIVGALLFVVLVLGVLDNRKEIAENNRLWCPVLAIVGSNDPPRTTDAGQRMVHELHRLGQQPAYGCW